MNDGTVSVGGMTRHAEVAASDAIPALADLASRIGDAHVRNRGTIGGSLANSDPAADYPAALVALGGTVHTTNGSIAGGDYFTGLFETALPEGEIVTSVDFCTPDAAAYEKFPNPASRYAVVGVMVARCGRLRLCGRHWRRCLRLPRHGVGGSLGGGFLTGCRGRRRCRPR